jgi:phosphonate transport system substrate-binding protein
MISPKETFLYYYTLLEYVGAELGLDVQFIQRKTYEEINDLLSKGEVDLAFVCSGPYSLWKQKYGLQLIATPEVQGSHFYQSYLIVNKDSPIRRLEELRGKIFAFTDPDSNTGKLVPAYWLTQIGERPETFFEKIIYTYSHDNSILAVARALVDGATVDGLVWEFYRHRSPAFVSATRIIRKSDLFGVPPLVTSRSVESELRDRIQDLFFSMHADPKGKTILEGLMIDRFVKPQEEWYEGIRQMNKSLSLLANEPHAPASQQP